MKELILVCLWMLVVTIAGCRSARTIDMSPPYEAEGPIYVEMTDGTMIYAAEPIGIGRDSLSIIVLGSWSEDLDQRQLKSIRRSLERHETDRALAIRRVVALSDIRSVYARETYPDDLKTLGLVVGLAGLAAAAVFAYFAIAFDRTYR